MPRAKRSPIVAPLVVLASALVSGTLLAGGTAAVKGKVQGWDKLFPALYAEAAKPDAHRYTWREPSPTVKQDFRKLTASVSRDVCVAAIGSGAAQPHDSEKVYVTGGRITPSTIVVSPGTRLQFKNSDPFPHQLYEEKNAAWAPTATAPGSTRDYLSAAPGVHVIHDQLFPSIVMYVVVEPNAVDFAMPDREGNFSLQVPPGEYTLKAYFDGKPTGKPQDGVNVGGHDVDLREPLGLGGT
jgi:hypothetical protein